MYRKGWVELERSWKVAVEARNGRRRVGKVLEGHRTPCPISLGSCPTDLGLFGAFSPQTFSQKGPEVLQLRPHSGNDGVATHRNGPQMRPMGLGGKRPGPQKRAGPQMGPIGLTRRGTEPQWRPIGWGGRGGPQRGVGPQIHPLWHQEPQRRPIGLGGRGGPQRGVGPQIHPLWHQEPQRCPIGLGGRRGGSRIVSLWGRERRGGPQRKGGPQILMPPRRPIGLGGRREGS